jgi:predicted phage baseplate assembly protein
VPDPHVNAPGLPALSYRAGTHGTFTAALHHAVSASPALRSLTTREADDPSMALLDGAASVLDVLTFYSERIANEGFLRTATERGSVQQLAAEIGYRLNPGVASSTHLAFTMDDVPGAPDSVLVRAGSQAQSVPAQDALPHTFETVEDLEARPEWNALRARSRQPEDIRTGASTIHLRGTSTGLRVGEALLLVGAERRVDPTSDRWDVRRVAAIEEQPDSDPAEAGVTVVTFDVPLGSVRPASAPPGPPPSVYALRDRAALFGHNAMRWTDLPLPLRVGELPPGGGKVIPGPYAQRQSTWADARLPIGTTQIDLDRVVPGVVKGSWIALTAPGRSPDKPDVELFAVTGVTERSVADFLLTSKVTSLAVSGENISYFTRRTATVLCVSAELELADRPLPSDVAGRDVDLAAPAALPAGRTVAVTGARAGDGAAAAEIAIVHAANGATLHLHGPLTNTYRRDSVVVYANVAAATHGEARTEILGSGDSRRAFQSFALHATPLTYVGASARGGTHSTLTVRVDGIVWHEVPTLYLQPPDAHVYVLGQADDGTVTVQFGDGVTGARLPTGQNNVRADYRVGIGLEAELDAGRITLLLSRPLGLTGVVNPVPARGAADPEGVRDARANAPTTVLTLDRVVSLDDYAAFVRAFAGVGKAAAVALWHAPPGQPLSAGEQRVVHVTVGTAAQRPLAVTDELHGRLLAAIDAARHPARPVVLDGYAERHFLVGVAVRIDPDRDSDAVRAAVAAALASAFSFSGRDFAQDVTSAEVLAVAQRVPGVLGAVLDWLHLTGAPTVHDRLEAKPARVEASVFAQAELLTVAADGITVRELTP